MQSLHHTPVGDYLQQTDLVENHPLTTITSIQGISSSSK